MILSPTGDVQDMNGERKKKEKKKESVRGVREVDLRSGYLKR